MARGGAGDGAGWAAGVVPAAEAAPGALCWRSPTALQRSPLQQPRSAGGPGLHAPRASDAVAGASAPHSQAAPGAAAPACSLSAPQESCLAGAAEAHPSHQPAAPLLAPDLHQREQQTGSGSGELCTTTHQQSRGLKAKAESSVWPEQLRISLMVSSQLGDGCRC